MLSRNFRLQKVGDLDWLQKNYNFKKISFSIDELIVLDVSRGGRCTDNFCSALKNIQDGCFVPIAAGGGVRTLDHARKILRSGADKVVVNSALHEDEMFIRNLAKEFGEQCVVGSVDLKQDDGAYSVMIRNGEIDIESDSTDFLKKISNLPVGEIYLNSIDNDGTGMGYDFGVLGLIPHDNRKSIILAGGAGNSTHLFDGILNQKVDAVATAHLFNFIGDGLKKARLNLIERGVDLPLWEVDRLDDLFR